MINRKERITRESTSKLGHEYKINHWNIDINITYACDMSCSHCNRFLDIAPSDVRMSVEQIQKFVAESVADNRKWNRICITGGEPILHPDALQIAEIIASYKREYSPSTLVLFMTNDLDPEGEKKSKLGQLPAEVIVHGSKKDSIRYDHKPMAVAPEDLLPKDVDYANACYLTEKCGLGLDYKGYYHCAVAAAIDRLHQINFSRNSLPNCSDDMKDMMNKYCSKCGMFMWSRGLSVTEGEVSDTRRGPVSKSWEHLVQISTKRA